LSSGIDVKDIWEPARFAWVYDLLRGYAITGDETFAETFWIYFDSFMQGCPPFFGIQWSCGQETAIRATAWLWAEEGFRHSRASSPERMARLRSALYASGIRIRDAIGYALSQRNNHAISEATGLVLLGARFAEHNATARQWYTLGHRLLERLVHDQIAPDGWYIQHSFNYLRVALDQLVLAELVLRSRGDSISASARARISAAATLLMTVCDGSTGDVPNHGPNDGAYMLPLTLGVFRDFRPTLMAVATAFHLPLVGTMQWDAEISAWLGEYNAPVNEPTALAPLVVGKSGWISARWHTQRVFARAGTYPQSRPGHIDPLHLDIWIDDKPVAIDAGTYRYNGPHSWQNALSGLEVHNTVSIADLPIASRVTTFLWAGSPVATIEQAEQRTDSLFFVLRNDSWTEHGIMHRRCVTMTSSSVLVEDILVHQILDVSPRQAIVHWLIDGDNMPAITGPAGIVVERTRGGATTGAFGWVSWCYGTKLSASSIRCSVTLPSNQEVRIISTFSKET
jgi:hypothetical protein